MPQASVVAPDASGQIRSTPVDSFSGCRPKRRARRRGAQRTARSIRRGLQNRLLRPSVSFSSLAEWDDKKTAEHAEYTEQKELCCKPNRLVLFRPIRFPSAYFAYSAVRCKGFRFSKPIHAPPLVRPFLPRPRTSEWPSAKTLSK